MIRVVVDTNVLVSALLNPHGMPGRILDAMLQGILECAVDARVLDEYREVLSRPSFGFASHDIDRLLAFIERTGHHVLAPPLRARAKDPDDQAFLEVAVAGNCVAIVTGNGSHFDAGRAVEVRVLPPAAFVREFIV